MPNSLRSAFTGKGIHIGHLDSGVDASHEALKGKVKDFLLVDNKGQIENQGNIFDTGSHGTHTAGIICGEDSNEKFQGIAPDARLFAAAVIEDGDNLIRMIRGIEWLLDKDIRILCMAFGFSGRNPVLYSFLEALAQKDVLILAAIGNSRLQGGYLPGIYPNVLAVGACDEAGMPAPFSASYSNHYTKECLKPEILAPGVGINSAIPGQQYRSIDGTSQACAHVAGLAALLMEAVPKASASQVAEALIQSANFDEKVHQGRCRYGAVQEERALAYLQGKLDLPPKVAASSIQLPKRYIDPTLKRMGHEAPDSIVAVIVIVEEAIKPEKLVEQLAQQLSERPQIVHYSQEVPHAVILRISIRFLFALMKEKQVTILSPGKTKNLPTLF